MARIMYTLDWMIANQHIDSRRVYLAGTSMGAAACVMVSMLYPDRFAAAELVVPKFNFAQLTDWQGALYNFSSGALKRQEADRKWGDVTTSNLNTDLDDPLAPGLTLRIYQATKADTMAHLNHTRSLPIIFAVNGKNDEVVGWTEKLAYYDSAEANWQGGFYFWDLREHTGGVKTWDKWEPDFLLYRTDLSYPAFSDCSISDAATDGVAAPTVGTRNGWLDWSENLIDDSCEWRDTLRYRTGLKWGAAAASAPVDSCTARVTLRRLQAFGVGVGQTVYWKNYKVGTGLVQSGSFVYAGGPISVPGVTIYKGGNVLRVYRSCVGPGGAPGGAEFE